MAMISGASPGLGLLQQTSTVAARSRQCSLLVKLALLPMNDRHEFQHTTTL